MPIGAMKSLISNSSEELNLKTLINIQLQKLVQNCVQFI